MSSATLGLDAYADPDSNNADLLKNLEGCRVHGFSPGYGEHAGTALMDVELPTEEGLGVQIDMDTDAGKIPTYPATQSDDGTWEADRAAEYRTPDALEAACTHLEVLELAHYNIMDPETARVMVFLKYPNRDPFAVELYLHDDGGTDFFEVDL